MSPPRPPWKECQTRIVNKVLTGAVALVLVAGGCGGSSDSGELAQVRAELDALKEQVSATAAPTTTAGAPSNPGNTKNCSDFSTYSDAKTWFDTYFPYYGDVASLDSDNDGEPCESLPSGPAPTTTTTTSVAPTTTASTTSFGSGIWAVGSQVQPGTWMTSNVSFCYWKRLSGFDGSYGDTIESAIVDGNVIVEISSSDAGFSSNDDCGTWTRQN